MAIEFRLWPTLSSRAVGDREVRRFLPSRQKMTVQPFPASLKIACCLERSHQKSILSEDTFNGGRAKYRQSSKSPTSRSGVSIFPKSTSDQISQRSHGRRRIEVAASFGRKGTWGTVVTGNPGCGHVDVVQVAELARTVEADQPRRRWDEPLRCKVSFSGTSPPHGSDSPRRGLQWQFSRLTAGGELTADVRKRVPLGHSGHSP